MRCTTRHRLSARVVHEDARIIFGAVADERLGHELQVTVIATGFHHREAEARRAGARRDEQPAGNAAAGVERVLAGFACKCALRRSRAPGFRLLA